MKTIPTITLVCCAALAAACTTTPQASRLPGSATMPQTPRSMVDGQWLDKNGIISSFSAGQFETRTSDTNQVLALGTYTENGSLVEIELTSVLRQTRSRVNCAVVAPYLMNCTPSQGSGFSLYKPDAAPIGFTLQDAPAQTAAMPATQTMAGNTMTQMSTSAPAATYPATQAGTSF